jgi:hypothetical protein
MSPLWSAGIGLFPDLLCLRNAFYTCGSSHCQTVLIGTRCYVLPNGKWSQKRDQLIIGIDWQVLGSFELFWDYLNYLNFFWKTLTIWHFCDYHFIILQECHELEVIHKEYTEWQWPYTFWRTFHHDSKNSPALWGWGCTPSPFTLSSITSKIVLHSPV